jgi:hypothetical protein
VKEQAEKMDRKPKTLVELTTTKRRRMKMMVLVSIVLASIVMASPVFF